MNYERAFIHDHPGHILGTEEVKFMGIDILLQNADFSTSVFIQKMFDAFERSANVVFDVHSKHVKNLLINNISELDRFFVEHKLSYSVKSTDAEFFFNAQKEFDLASFKTITHQSFRGLRGILFISGFTPDDSSPIRDMVGVMPPGVLLFAVRDRTS